MRASDINRLMAESGTWKHQENTDARHAFIRTMRIRQFGLDALWSAWAWFLMGWRMSEMGADFAPGRDGTRPDERGPDEDTQSEIDGERGG